MENKAGLSDQEVDQLVNNSVKEKDVVSRQLSTLVDHLFQGQNIDDQYNQLEVHLFRSNDTQMGALDKKEVVCGLVCQRLAAELDASTPEALPASVSYVGKFFENVSVNNIIKATKEHIKLDRIIKYNLDEHPDWKPVFERVHKQLNDK